MGYTTGFDGKFTCTPPLRAKHRAYLAAFCATRRMLRDAAVAVGLPDPLREAVGLPVGEGGCYFVGGTGFCGQGDDPSVRDHNRSPKGQPSLWCQWQPTEDGAAIEWDGGEKFYDYIPWIRYLIEHFLAPWGYELNGVVEWCGEEQGDCGKICIENNQVHVLRGVISYVESDDD